MPGLAEPANLPVSQAFAGSFYMEPPGYVAYSGGRPLKAYGSKFPGSAYRHDLHRAIDAYGSVGTPLGAMEAGVVANIFTDGVGTKIIRVKIRGHSTVRYSFAHCASFLVPEGAKVARGQPIAKLGKSGKYTTGAHNHLSVEIREKGSDGVWRWIAYDPARFCPPGTFRFGGQYGPSGGGTVLFGGDMVYDDRIYPIRPVTINTNVNVRAGKDTDTAVLFTASAVTPASQINELPGGSYEINGTKGVLWAKIKVKNPSGLIVTAYVAKPLIKVV
jgi:murein DD-endopeptidase MepM/ murein hydrolase activator NlpD